VKTQMNNLPGGLAKNSRTSKSKEKKKAGEDFVPLEFRASMGQANHLRFDKKNDRPDTMRVLKTFNETKKVGKNTLQTR